MLTATIREDIQNILKAPLAWERFAGKRVLVTGAAGFLGGYFVELFLALTAAGGGPKETVGLVRNMARARVRFAHHLMRPDFTLVTADVAEPLPVEGRFDVIVHAASFASPKYYFTDPVGVLKPNAIGTFRLLERAKADKCGAFLFLSTSEVYGHAADTLLKEDNFGVLDPADLRSCYAESKRIGETMCVAAHHQYKVPAFIARPFHTYGPGLKPDDGRVFADFIADIAARRDLVVKSEGTARRAFCYVSDAMAGFFTLLLKGEPARPYNVGNEDAELSVRELAESLVAAFPERGLKVVLDASQAAPAYARSAVSRVCLDCTALRALGWAPAVGVAEGFKRTIASIEEAPQPAA